MAILFSLLTAHLVLVVADENDTPVTNISEAETLGKLIGTDAYELGPFLQHLGVGDPGPILSIGLDVNLKLDVPEK